MRHPLMQMLLFGCTLWLTLQALACVVAIPSNKCGSSTDPSCTNNCTGVRYEPYNSYCDSRDGDEGGLDCHTESVDCVSWQDVYLKIEDDLHNCLGCEQFPDISAPTGISGSASVAIVTGECCVLCSH